jgi:hypothetical protein
MRLTTACLLLLLAVPAAAQDSQPPQGPDDIDATKMGVSLARIQKGLRIAEATEQKRPESPLRLSFQIQVYGQAPRIDVLKDVDLFNGQVPGTPPTHKDVIEFLTPPMYRLPALPFAAFMGWAAQALANQNRKANCEAELANYRALLMQGVNVSAPRCTQ